MMLGVFYNVFVVFIFGYWAWMKIAHWLVISSLGV